MQPQEGGVKELAQLGIRFGRHLESVPQKSNKRKGSQNKMCEKQNKKNSARQRVGMLVICATSGLWPRPQHSPCPSNTNTTTVNNKQLDTSNTSTTNMDWAYGMMRNILAYFSTTFLYAITSRLGLIVFPYLCALHRRPLGPAGQDGVRGARQCWQDHTARHA